MNYFVVIPFITLLFNVIVTTHIWSQPRTAINRAYVVLSLTIMGWILMDVVHWSPIPDAWVMPALRIQSVFYLSVGFVFTNFSYVFLRKKRDLLYRVFFGMVLVAVPLGLFSDLVIRDFERFYWGPGIIGGPLYVPLIFSLVAPQYFYSMFLLFRRSRQTTNERERTQLFLFLSGNFLAAIISMITVVIFPQFLSMNPLPLHDVGMIVHLGFLAWAIARYRFLSMDVRDVAADLFSNVQDGVVVVDNNRSILQINQAALQIFNTSDKERVQQELAGLIDRLEQEGDKGMLEASIGPADDALTIRLSMSPVMHGDLRTGWIVFLRDITRQRESEAEIKRINHDLGVAMDHAIRANQAKSDFLANMSHELRTPLNAIIGYADLLHEEASEQELGQMADDLIRIQTSGQHLLTLINEVLDLSKIEAGKMQLQPELFPLDDLLEDVMTTLMPMAHKNHNRLSLVAKDTGFNLYTDRTKLRQTLFNLLSNACKFTENGDIELAVGRTGHGEDEALELIVTDTGIGIEPQDIDKLFQHFSQVDNSATRQFQGTGLGLAICREYCQLMGGGISVTSEPGQGSVFAIRFPLAVLQPPEDAQERRQA